VLKLLNNNISDILISDTATMESTGIARSPVVLTSPNLFSSQATASSATNCSTDKSEQSVKHLVSDDNEVFVNFQEQLEDLTKQITCMDATAGDSSDSDVWHKMNYRTLSDSVMTTATSTLTRRPRGARAATVCMTHVTNDPGSPGEHEREVFGRLSPHSSSSASSTSKSEEILDSGVLGCERRLKKLSSKMTSSHGSASSDLQRSSAQSSASVKNFVQSFEKLKDLSFSNRNSHSPSDLFPAHRSALASKDLVASTGQCVGSSKGLSLSAQQAATISLPVGSRDKNTVKGRDDRYFSLNVYRNDSLTRRFPEFIRSSQASGSQSKFFLNPKPNPKTFDVVEPPRNDGTLTRSRGISEDRGSQQPACVTNGRSQVQCFETCRGGQTPEGSVSDRGLEYSERAHQPLTRWTMTKHGRDLQKMNSLDSSEQRLMQQYASRRFSPTEVFPVDDHSRATSLSKFDDDDEYLMSPPTTSLTGCADAGTFRPNRMMKPTSGYRPTFRATNNGTPSCRDVGSCQNNSGGDGGALNGSTGGLSGNGTSVNSFRQNYCVGPASAGYTSQYATLRLPTGRRNNVSTAEAFEKRE